LSFDPPSGRPGQRDADLLAAGEPGAAAPGEKGTAGADDAVGAPGAAASGEEAETARPTEDGPDTQEHRPAGRRIALNTAIFSVATGLSRIAGLIREIVAARFFGTTGAASAFTLAFQVPNLIRSLFADAALSAAFVPVFTDLLEHRKRREAFNLAGALFGLILAVLGVITLIFMALAGVIIPLFTSPDFTPQLDDLAVGLSRVLFPILILLGLNGLLVGILNAYDHFTIPALAPLVWNVVIIAGMVGLRPLFEGPNELYAYALGVLAGTLVQFLMCIPPLRKVGFDLRISTRWRDPRIREVLLLMLPVTIGLGLINFNVLINTVLGFRVSEEAPAAIDRAFRVYMLPQGMFSVAIATVLFPAISRLAARRDYDGLRHTSANGVRQIGLLLIPAAAATLALATPITRLVYEGGTFDAQSTEQVSEALFWFSFSLPFAGANLMLTRTFFSLRRPWTPTGMGGATLLVNLAVSGALYRPFGIAGIVIGTAVASAAMTAGQAYFLRQRLHGIELATTLDAVAKMIVAAGGLGITAYLAWKGLDELLGRSRLAQLVSVTTALAAGTAVYTAAVLALHVPEAGQILELIRSRLRRSA
jgi:putative peptidoglycan lipid II flippase